MDSSQSVIQLVELISVDFVAIVKILGDNLGVEGGTGLDHICVDDLSKVFDRIPLLKCDMSLKIFWEILNWM